MNPPRSRQAVLLRSGGLGDFLLTLPLLHTLHNTYEQVALITRPSYRDLANRSGRAPAFLNVDGPDAASLFAVPSERIRAWIGGADLFTFIGRASKPFRRNLRALQIHRTFFLDSRPTSPPHVSVRMFDDTGLDIPEDLFERAWVGGAAGGGDLWIHPGSGSPAKNMPLSFFRDQAAAALVDPGRHVTLSFGEADGELIEPARRIFRGLPCRFVVRPSLSDLVEDLTRSAACCFGNDSGVSHLAAALGISTRVVFRGTSPGIWRPLGPRVTVLRSNGAPDGREGK